MESSMLDRKFTRRESLKTLGGLAIFPSLISIKPTIDKELVKRWSILLYTNIRSKAKIEYGHNKQRVIESLRKGQFYADLSSYKTKHVGIYGWVEIDCRCIGTIETYAIPMLKNSPKAVQKLHNDHMHPLAIQITEHIRANSAELYELNWSNYIEGSERYLKEYYANLG